MSKRALISCLTLLLFAFIITGCGGGGGTSKAAPSAGGSISNVDNSTPTSTPSVAETPFPTSALKAAPIATTEDETAQDVTFTGVEFGNYGGTVKISSLTKSANATVKSWSNTQVVATINAQAMQKGEYFFTIQPKNAHPFYYIGYTILPHGAPILYRVDFPTPLTLGRNIVDIQLQGANFWATADLSGTRFYAQQGENTPIELQLTAYNNDSTSIAILAPNGSLPNNGMPIKFYVAKNGVTSNVIKYSPLATGNVHALFIGINQYEYIDNPLSCCINDATSMRNALSVGTFNKLWENADIYFLTAQNATKANILNTLQTIATSLNDGDIFFMYYSGHGSYNNGETYIIPYDNDSTTTTAISSLELENVLQSMPESCAKVLIFDSCYCGGFIGKGIQKGTIKSVPLISSPNEIRGKGFKSISNKVKNLYFATACTSNEVTVEFTELQHGLFTYYLLEALGDSGNSYGTGLVQGETMIYTKNVIDYASYKINQYYNQYIHPQVYINPIGSDFPLKGNLK